LAAPLKAFSAEYNTLTAAEKKDGWKLLFDGKEIKGFHVWKKTTGPEKGWNIDDSSIHHIDKEHGGDIITDATFEDFDLQWDWKVALGANSGLKYFVSEERKQLLGHEYQLIDDERHPDAKLAEGKRVTASFYDVFAPHGAKPKPALEWNHSRILVKGNHVEHWLNGDKVLEYELGSDATKAAVAKSKFSKVEGFGSRVQCHLFLQDHGDEIWFRNLKIKELK
jgi:hypothetical protein